MRFAPVRRFGSAVLILCALAAPAYSQAQPSPEHVALARAVLDFTGARKSFDNVVPKLIFDARRNILSTRPTLEADLDPILVKIGDRMQAADEELVNQIALVYARKFTEAELKDIVAFYQSPSGKKMTAELPSVLSDSYKHMQEWSQKVSVDIMTEIRTEMKKKGHDL